MKPTGKGRGTSSHRSPWRPLYWMPILTVMLCLISAQLILWGKLPYSAHLYIPRILGAVISFLGGFRGTRIATQKRFLWGMVNTGAYLCMLMVGNLLFFGETFGGIRAMILWVSAGGVLGSMVANMKQSKIA